jgi:hypothetical protein
MCGHVAVVKWAWLHGCVPMGKGKWAWSYKYGKMCVVRSLRKVESGGREHIGLVTLVWSSYCCGDVDVLRLHGRCGTIALSKKLLSRHLSHIKDRHDKV